MCGNTGVNTLGHMCKERRTILGIDLHLLPCLRQGFFFFIFLAASWLTVVSLYNLCLLPFPRNTGTTGINYHIHVYISSEDSNSGLHAFTPSALTTEQSLQSIMGNF